MSNDPIQTAVQQLVRTAIASPSTTQGCTEQEIQQIETQFSLQLPQVYRRYLSVIGRSAGQFMQGSDFLYPTLLKLREQAERLLQESEAQLVLLAQDFVFLVHQGYEFLYFDSRAGDDPPVWFYLEKEAQPKKLFDHFSEWLLAAVSDETED